jgi:hypothetical protein
MFRVIKAFEQNIPLVYRGKEPTPKPPFYTWLSTLGADGY